MISTVTALHRCKPGNNERLVNEHGINVFAVSSGGRFVMFNVTRPTPSAPNIRNVVYYIITNTSAVGNVSAVELCGSTTVFVHGTANGMVNSALPVIIVTTDGELQVRACDLSGVASVHDLPLEPNEMLFTVVPHSHKVSIGEVYIVDTWYSLISSGNISIGGKYVSLEALCRELAYDVYAVSIHMTGLYVEAMTSITRRVDTLVSIIEHRIGKLVGMFVELPPDRSIYKLVGTCGLSDPHSWQHLCGSTAPGNMAHGNMAHGNMAHGNMAHGNMAHGNMAHGNMAHGNMAPGSTVGDDALVVNGCGIISVEPVADKVRIDGRLYRLATPDDMIEGGSTFLLRTE